MVVFNFGAVLFTADALGDISACVLATLMPLTGIEFLCKVGFMFICEIWVEGVMGGTFATWLGFGWVVGVMIS